jgi:hypothetical protein
MSESDIRGVPVRASRRPLRRHAGERAPHGCDIGECGQARLIAQVLNLMCSGCLGEAKMIFPLFARIRQIGIDVSAMKHVSGAARIENSSRRHSERRFRAHREVGHDRKLRAAKCGRHRVAPERDRIGPRNVLLIADREPVGQKCEVDLGLANEERSHRWAPLYE